MNITRAALRENINKHLLVLFEKNHRQILSETQRSSTTRQNKSQVTFIYIALLTIQIVSKHLTVSILKSSI